MDSLLSRDDILALPDRVAGGTIRHTFAHPDEDEQVAVNNLLALTSELCTDFSGNRFGGYFVVPTDFWRLVKKDWASKGNDPKLLPKNKFGGFMGMFPYFTIYVGGTDKVILKPDQGELIFEFEIGEDYDVIRKGWLIDTYGYKKVGYDKRLVFVPWWSTMGIAYAPPPLLRDWIAEDGFKPAVDILTNPPQAALEQWYQQGYLPAPTREALSLAAPVEVG